MTTLYGYLHAAKGAAYKPEQIKSFSWLNKKPEIDRSVGRVAGNSRIHGDATIEVQSRVIDMLVEIGARYKLSYREIAYLLLMTKVESGFNPDAAAGTTSAAGLGQYTKATVVEAAKDHLSKKRLGFSLDLSGECVLDAQRGAYGVLLSYMICKERALRYFGSDYENHIYLFHHEGWYFQATVEKLAAQRVKDVYAIIAKHINPHLRPVEALLKANATVQFELKTSDDKPYADQPYVAIRPRPNPGIAKTPASAQASLAGTVDVVVGKTDGTGRSTIFNLKSLEELVFVILTKDYREHADVKSPVQSAYTVKPGDSLGQIAKRNGTTTEELARINGISNPNRLSAGQTIKLAGEQIYRVKPGDSVSKIAAANGMTVDELAKLNNIKNPNQLAIGQELVLYRGERIARRPEKGFLAEILGDKLNLESLGALDAIVEHVRSHVVLPAGNQAHQGSDATNVITIRSGSTAQQVAQRSAEQSVAHKTNEEKTPKVVMRPNVSAGAALRDKMLFPLTFRPPQSYKQGMRKFGWPRQGGKRKHAGCDLYAPVGTSIRAMDKGTVVQVSSFYLGTDVIVIDHGGFILRYGELMPGSHLVKAGDPVSRGQVISKVGKLQGINMSMLHIEAYSSSGDVRKNPLTVKGHAPYMRRSDLIDITPTLDSAILND